MLGRFPVLGFLRMALASSAVLTCVALAQAEGGDGGGGSGGGAGSGAGAGGAGSTGAGHGQGGSHGQGEGEGEGAAAPAASGASAAVSWPRASANELRFEQDLARDAVSQGQIQPLDSILRYAEFAAPGSVLSARLKKDGIGLWTYTLTILSAGGRYREVVLNAKTGVVLSIK